MRSSSATLSGFPPCEMSCHVCKRPTTSRSTTLHSADCRTITVLNSGSNRCQAGRQSWRLGTCPHPHVLQSVLQFLFLKEQQAQHSLDNTADSTVIFSIGVSLSMTLVAGIKGCYALSRAEGERPPVAFKAVALTITGQPVAEV